MGVMTLDELRQRIRTFRDERDWDQFHTPKNLAAGLSIEAAELQELMLWKTDGEVSELLSTHHGPLSDEIADVLIFALLFCEAARVDPEAAVLKKLEKNAEKYPVEKSKGNAAKYTELD